jgi:hypothetical protein
VGVEASATTATRTDVTLPRQFETKLTTTEALDASNGGSGPATTRSSTTCVLSSSSALKRSSAGVAVTAADPVTTDRRSGSPTCLRVTESRSGADADSVMGLSPELTST